MPTYAVYAQIIDRLVLDKKAEAPLPVCVWLSVCWIISPAKTFTHPPTRMHKHIRTDARPHGRTRTRSNAHTYSRTHIKTHSSHTHHTQHTHMTGYVLV
jgi:hypothetical protein